jgi:hypothetical protein
MTFKSKFRPGKDKKCWCGSKRKEKNCHGKQSVSHIPSPPTQPPQFNVNTLSMGVSGEESKLWVLPVFKGEDPASKIPNFKGNLGKYKVQLLLSRPGYPLWAEREHKFIDGVNGDSHILIAKPAAHRLDKDAVQIHLHAVNASGEIAFKGLPNENGYLGKLVVDELIANDFNNAESRAYESLAPFLSAWSLHLDIPVNVHTIQVTELSSNVTSVRARAPHFEMTFGGGITPLLSDEFCHHASVYREGMNTNSPFYRFLCFFKIIESIIARRSKRNADNVANGHEIVRYHEAIPSTGDEAIRLLRLLFPWKATWDEVPLDELFPTEVRGKKVGSVVDRFNKIRVGIAHAVLDTGEIRISIDKLTNIQQVNKWLPLCRILARWLLRQEFTSEYDFKMKEDIPQSILSQYPQATQTP